MVVRQRELFWQIFLVFLAVLLLSIVLVAWFSARTIEEYYLNHIGQDMEDRANLLRVPVAELLADADSAALRSLAVEAGRASGTRITVIAPDGLVLADTKEDPGEMDNHRDRPEIDTAFAGSPGRSLRFSNTLGQRMLYAAIPIYGPTGTDSSTAGRGPVLAALRMSVPVTAIDAALDTIRTRIIWGAVVLTIGAFAATYLISRSISRPLEEMTRQAERYALGDFSERMSLQQKRSASKEIVALATAMDRMAGQLNDTISTILSQRNRLEAVFSSMAEAVIAVDRDERVISINDAAARMFDVEFRDAQGRLIQEVIRNLDLHAQIERILVTGESFEDEIILTGPGGKIHLQTSVVSLHGRDAEPIGVLVVLNDVTELKKLERMRSDFVANVSHELRTPITSIRGYVETLLDGAIDDREDALAFLEIVLRQSEQLEEIIDDLLALSRIERESRVGEIVSEPQELRPALEEAVESCRHRADERGVAIRLECPERIVVSMNQTLIEQAVLNLLINGITYSDPGQEVVVRAGEQRGPGGRTIVISIIDRGVGIAAEHLPRLFERFYRSDRARSRKAGGTGLGLAIVKHIVQAHGGSVDVSSQVGKGSEFTITLPG